MLYYFNTQEKLAYYSGIALIGPPFAQIIGPPISSLLYFLHPTYPFYFLSFLGIFQCILFILSLQIIHFYCSFYTICCCFCCVKCCERCIRLVHQRVAINNTNNNNECNVDGRGNNDDISVDQEKPLIFFDTTSPQQLGLFLVKCTQFSDLMFLRKKNLF